MNGDKSVEGTSEWNGVQLEICNGCRKPAKLQCATCNDFYCSTQCQRFDFRRHRHICFPMPTLVLYREYHKNELIKKEDQICENCQIVSSKCCEKCGFAYCSVRCQISNWERHRYICFPMPKLVKKTLEVQNHRQDSTNNINDNNKSNKSFTDRQNATNKNNSLNKNNQNNKMQSPNNTKNGVTTNVVMPAENDQVVVTAFPMINRVRVRSTSDEIDKDFNEILEKINENGKNGKPMSIMPQKGNVFALAQFEDKWYRVLIIETLEDYLLRVFLVDIGGIRFCHLKNMKEIPPELTALKQYSVRLELYQVPQLKMNQKMHNFFSNYEGKVLRLKYRSRENKKDGIELYEEGEKKSLNEKIIEELKRVALYNTEKTKACTMDADPKPPNNKPFNMPKANAIVTDNDIEAADPKLLSNNPFKMAKTNEDVIDIIEAVADPKPLNKKPLEMSKSNKNESQIKDAVTKPLNKKPLEMSNPNENESEIKAADPQPLNKKPFKMLILNENVTDIQAALLDHSNISVGYIGCIPMQYAKKLLEIKEFMNTIDDKTPYKPELHEYCLAYYGDELYRAQCNKIVDSDSFNLIYLDFTNEAIVASKDIRKYPANLNIDCNTIICFIRDLPKKLNAKQVEVVSNFLDNVKFVKLTNIELLDPPFYVAEYTDLIKTLQQAELLE